MQFDEDYYLNGVAKGVSNYENYRWLPKETTPMARRLVEFFGASKDEQIWDFGCARGYLIKALREMGYQAFGNDISDWAIEHCDPEVEDYVFNGSRIKMNVSYVIAKDVLEHIPEVEMENTIRHICGKTREALIVVPLARNTGGEYFRKEDESDVTHRIRWTFNDWMRHLQHISGHAVLGTTHIEGLKPASKQQPGSTGFFLIRT